MLVHGLGEHSGRYRHVAASLTGAGLAVYALDHRGHGRSDGPRALIDRAARAIADIDALARIAREAHPSPPLLVLGHSMGGLLALGFAHAHSASASGMILTGPLAAAPRVPPGARIAGRVLSALAPTAPLLAPIDPRLVSRDPQVVEDYRRDPLVHHGRLPARTAAELAGMLERVPELAAGISLPTLIAYGTEDRLCPPSGSEMLARRLAGADVTLRAYDGLFHEVLNEPERDRVIADILDWIAARLPGP